MAKSIVVPPAPVSTHLWADGKYRTYPEPAAGPDKLLTFDTAKIGNSTYKYLDFASRYVGAFRVTADVGGAGLGTARYSYGALGFNPNGGGLLTQGHNTQDIIAEYNIPTPVNATLRSQISTLPLATAKQSFSAGLRGAGIAPTLDHMICGMYSDGTRMLLHIFGMYEQSSSGMNTNVCVFRNVADLAGSVVDGWMHTNHPSWTTGPVCPIPAAYQSALGGTHLCGLSGSTARASKASLSEGPCAASFDANALMTNSAAIGTGTVTYNRLMRHHLYGILSPSDDALYNWDSANGVPLNNKMWTHTSEISAMIILPGTKTLLCMGGSSGHVGGLDYGTPPWGGNKGHYPRDPTDTYAYYWMVDLDDLAAVYAGTLAYNMVVPYEAGKLNVPFQPTPGTAPFFYVGGIAINEANNIMYLSLRDADDSQGYGAPPLILTYNAGAV